MCVCERERERERESQSRIELFRKFEAEGYGLTADLNVSVVATFPMWTGSGFQTDGPE